MRLFDAQSGGLREVELRPHMSVYVCGITPYDSAHMGHAFTYVQFDVLVRYLRHLGVQVQHAQNVTDVDDDILRVAKERGVDFRDLAEAETKAFEQQMEAIGVSPPTFSPRATEFVPEMVDEIATLIERGHGYQRERTVYFRVASDPGYGRLSRLDREKMVEFAAERGGHPEDPNKDDPLDFVLWQPSAPGEPEWESPWGRGRPGWHIECSTMARNLLGQPVDVHGGGTDLIFPHHESERAQAEGAHSQPFVRYWMHTGEVSMGSEKMSKSLGNLVFVKDLLDRHDPLDIRKFLLRRHYREAWDFDEGVLSREAAGEDPQPTRVDERVPATRREFFRALDEDLDTPSAMRLLDRAATQLDPASEALVAEGKAVLGLAGL